MNRTQILATGPAFVGRGVRGTEPVITSLLEDAKKEVQILAYVLTPRATGLLNLLGIGASRGVKVTLVVNDLASLDESLKETLSRLSRQYAHFKIVDFSTLDEGQLHAKVVVVDRSKAVLGSANFSYGGMLANYEIGVLVEGESAWKLAKLIDTLVLRASKQSKK